MVTDEIGPERAALILYGTETGTAQDAAEEAARVLERLHFVTNVVGLDSVSTTDLSSYTLCLFVVSTTGQGDFPSNARQFWTNLLRKKLRADFLNGLHYALIGLGDSSYPKFNWAARKLDKRLKQLGAQEVTEACEADEQGDEGIDGSILAWLREFRTTMLSLYPLREDQQPIPDDVLLPGSWRLQISEDESIPSVHSKEVLRHHSQEAAKPDEDLHKCTSPFWVTLQKNERVTPASHWQDVRFLTLTTEKQVHYQPGDVLAVRPKNTREDVDAIIHQMKWIAYADLPLGLMRTRPCRLTISTPPAWPSKDKGHTLRGLLTSYFDITAIPRRSFFAKIANYTEVASHKDRLLEFTRAEYLDEYYDYATRPRRSILEVLQEFDSVHIPWEEAVNVFPALRPRQFSIASGGALRSRPDGGTTFELLIAVVKYRTVIKKIRQGVCTRYLAALPAGTILEVDLRTEGRFSRRTERQPPCYVLIGAGTGIAPLRSLIHEKQAVIPQDHGTVLFFGARSATSDFFFFEEWSAMVADGGNKCLHLITAFSRDQKRKIYVQDRIRENENVIFDALCNKKATVVVCGSSGQMPKAVREALVDALTSARTKDKKTDFADARQGAELYLANMEKQKRYLQETW